MLSREHGGAQKGRVKCSNSYRHHGCIDGGWWRAGAKEKLITELTLTGGYLIDCPKKRKPRHYASTAGVSYKVVTASTHGLGEGPITWSTKGDVMARRNAL